MGRLLEPTQRTRTASATELPKYNPDTKQIEWEGKWVDAPDGTKFETDDGKQFVLHHARTVKGGWKAMRVVVKSDANKAAANAAKRK